MAPTPTPTTVRTAQEVKNALSSKLSITYKELGEVLGIDKVTGQTPIPGTDRTLTKKIHEHRNRAAEGDVSSQKPQGVEDESTATRTPKAPKPGSVGELAAQYHDLGFKNVSVAMLDTWFPELKGTSRTLYGRVIPTNEQRAEIVDTFNVLMAIRQQLEEDRGRLTGWKLPNIDEMTGNEIYSYTGICGHQVEMSQRLVLDRLSNQNSKVPPVFRLCAGCRAVRAALLNMVPRAAQAESICSVCSDPTFVTGAHGWAKSRADIWENLLSDVMGVLNLPFRLRPEHLDSSGKHQALVRNRAEFEKWKEAYILRVSFAIAAHPELGAELKARMEGEIEAKRLELGLPKENGKTDIKKGSGHK